LGPLSFPSLSFLQENLPFYCKVFLFLFLIIIIWFSYTSNDNFLFIAPILLKRIYSTSIMAAASSAPKKAVLLKNSSSSTYPSLLLLYSLLAIRGFFKSVDTCSYLNASLCCYIKMGKCVYKFLHLCVWVAKYSLWQIVYINFPTDFRSLTFWYELSHPFDIAW